MSLYVHPVVVDNDVAASNNFKSTKIRRSAQERHREEAEIRNVYVMFVNPMIETRILKNERKNRELYQQLNDIMTLASRELERYCGHIRQFIVDDKGMQNIQKPKKNKLVVFTKTNLNRIFIPTGLVLIITFGLRGTTIPNM